MRLGRRRRHGLRLLRAMPDRGRVFFTRPGTKGWPGANSWLGSDSRLGRRDRRSLRNWLGSHDGWNRRRLPGRLGSRSTGRTGDAGLVESARRRPGLRRAVFVQVLQELGLHGALDRYCKYAV
jgi:hypothetical protein